MIKSVYQKHRLFDPYEGPPTHEGPPLHACVGVKAKPKAKG